MYEKGITDKLDVVQINLAKMENRKPPYTDLNPAGQVPALQLPDGTIITEVTVICELLEDMYPNMGPNMIGKTPVERALTRMMCRRVDNKVAEPMFNAFRYAEGFKVRERSERPRRVDV
jgi:glutathione S-transferase